MLSEARNPDRQPLGNCPSPSSIERPSHWRYVTSLAIRSLRLGGNLDVERLDAEFNAHSIFDSKALKQREVRVASAGVSDLSRYATQVAKRVGSRLLELTGVEPTVDCLPAS